VSRLQKLSFTSSQKYPSNVQGITVEVELRYNGQALRAEAKVDTGSEFCIFQRELGETLGIDIETGEKQTIATAKGSFDAYGHSLAFSTLEHALEGFIYFTAESNFPRNVLGRRGWLDRLRVGIIDYDRMLFVAHYDAENAGE
jgi:hypothetical protein